MGRGGTSGTDRTQRAAAAHGGVAGEGVPADRAGDAQPLLEVLADRTELLEEDRGDVKVALEVDSGHRDRELLRTGVPRSPPRVSTIHAITAAAFRFYYL
jgi:hypothetical protein